MTSSKVSNFSLSAHSRPTDSCAHSLVLANLAEPAGLTEQESYLTGMSAIGALTGFSSGPGLVGTWFFWLMFWLPYWFQGISSERFDIDSCLDPSVVVFLVF